MTASRLMKLSRSLRNSAKENVKPGWTGVHGMLYVKANYQLLIDNILDLTHVVFVHKTTLAGGGVAETPLQVEIDGDVVRAQRLMHRQSIPATRNRPQCRRHGMSALAADAPVACGWRCRLSPANRPRSRTGFANRPTALDGSCAGTPTSGRR